MQILIYHKRRTVPQLAMLRYPFISLFHDGWDDFGWKTRFLATLHLTDEKEIDLGAIRIAADAEGFRADRLPVVIEKLPKSSASLGESIAYYRRIPGVSPPIRRRYLQTMQDIVAKPERRRRIGNGTQWKKSLMREASSRHALKRGGFYIGTYHERVAPPRFSFSMTLSGASAPHEVDVTRVESGCTAEQLARRQHPCHRVVPDPLALEPAPGLDRDESEPGKAAAGRQHHLVARTIVREGIEDRLDVGFRSRIATFPPTRCPNHSVHPSGYLHSPIALPIRRNLRSSVRNHLGTATRRYNNKRIILSVSRFRQLSGGWKREPPASGGASSCIHPPPRRNRCGTRRASHPRPSRRRAAARPRSDRRRRCNRFPTSPQPIPPKHSEQKRATAASLARPRPRSSRFGLVGRQASTSFKELRHGESRYEPLSHGRAPPNRRGASFSRGRSNITACCRGSMSHEISDALKRSDGTAADYAIRGAARLLGCLIARDRIRSWARPFGGGNPVRLRASAWELDDFSARFARSAIDPDRPFDRLAEPTHWIFVDLDDWNAVLEASVSDLRPPPPPRIRSGRSRSWTRRGTGHRSL